MTVLQLVAWPPTVWFAFLSLLGVTVEYLVLVNPCRNKGAKRLLFLLTMCVLLMSITLARIYFGDWPGRYEVLSVLFTILGISVIYLGWNIYSDQREGARQYRNRPPAE